MNKKRIEEIINAQKKIKELAKLAKDTKNQVIGMDENDAVTLIEDNGLRARVVCRNGKHFGVTMDYRIDRINLTVVDGKITRTQIG